ncbi:glycosyltransferase family 39 protein [Arenimonas composti]|nr:glycosyltransferase family 39 protein [Arenimonas composti]
MSVNPARARFLALWCVLLAAKAWLAARLPAFGDEAFYAQESRHLAWAYSDVPALTAWLARAGSELAGDGIFAIRLPFLLLGALLPWLVVRIAARWFGNEAGWQAGTLALLLPLAATAGVLALPDVPLLFAALLCVDAVARLLRDARDRVATLQLAFALALGALAHYRFAAVIVAGAAGLLMAPTGRDLLRRPAILAALAAGIAGWAPLLGWNLAHAGAGVAFQFVDRHPWQAQAAGLAWLPVQAVLLTPPLCVLLLATLARAWRQRHAAAHWALLAGTGAVATLGWGVLAFFADRERVSFHWPLAGWLLLTVAAPAVLAGWRPWVRRAVFGLAAIGTAALFAYAGLQTSPAARAELAATPAWADEFAGWDEAAAAVRAELAAMPAGSRVVADNFLLGAQLSLALGRDDIAVLPHPRNGKHGRAAQLALWDLATPGRSGWGEVSVLLVVEDTARPLKDRLRGYDALCARTGLAAPPRIVAVDRGRKRFLLWSLPAGPAATDGAPGAGAAAGCRLPALAWIDAPAPGSAVGGRLAVEGWAWRPGERLAAVEVLIDGVPVARADYGNPRPDVLAYWGRGDAGEDPGVGFRAELDTAVLAPGRYWLGLRLHGGDGRIEDWPEQVLRIER